MVRVRMGASAFVCHKQVRSEADGEGEVAGVSAVVVDGLAEEGPLVLADALQLHLLLPQLDLAGQALHSLDVREALPPQLVRSPLHLLDARGETTDPAQSLQSPLGVHQRRPGVGHVQEQRVRIHLHALHCEPIPNYVPPGGGDVGEAEVLEKLLGDLCALLVELEGIEVAVLDGLRECAGEGPRTRSCLHHHAPRQDVEFEKDSGIVHSVQNLRFPGQRLSDKSGLGLEGAQELARFVEGLDLGSPGLVDEIEMAVGGAIGSLDLIAGDEALQLGLVLLLEEDDVGVVLHALLSRLHCLSLHIIREEGQQD